jgi:hypothetical protein
MLRAFTREKSAHHQAPSQYARRDRHDEREQPEGDRTVDLIDHPPEFMPKKPVMNVSGTTMAARAPKPPGCKRDSLGLAG